MARNRNGSEQVKGTGDRVEVVWVDNGNPDTDSVSFVSPPGMKGSSMSYSEFLKSYPDSVFVNHVVIILGI